MIREFVIIFQKCKYQTLIGVFSATIFQQPQHSILPPTPTPPTTTKVPYLKGTPWHPVTKRARRRDLVPCSYRTGGAASPAAVVTRSAAAVMTNHKLGLRGSYVIYGYIQQIRQDRVA